MPSLYATLPVVSCSTCYHQSKKKCRTVGKWHWWEADHSLYCDSRVHDVLNQTSDLNKYNVSSLNIPREKKKEKEAKKNKIRPLVSLMRTQQRSHSHQWAGEEEQLFFSIYSSTCSCLSEKADWLARVLRGALMSVCGRVWVWVEMLARGKGAEKKKACWKTALSLLYVHTWPHQRPFSITRVLGQLLTWCTFMSPSDNIKWHHTYVACLNTAINVDKNVFYVIHFMS